MLDGLLYVALFLGRQTREFAREYFARLRHIAVHRIGVNERQFHYIFLF